MAEPNDLPLDDPAFRESAREFHLAEYVAILRRHWKVVALCVAAALALSIVYSSLSRPLFRATTTLLLEENRGAPLGIEMLRADLGSDAEFIPTQMRLMKSRAVAERVVRRFDLVSAKGSGQAADAVTRAALGIQGRVETKIVRGTNLVELAFVAGTPVQAADYANAVAEAFLEWDLESRYQSVEQSSQFLMSQIEQLRSEVSEKEQQLLAYGRQKDILSVDPGTNVTLQKLESLNRDYASAVADRVAKEARWYEVRTAPAESIAETASAGVVGQLRNEIARLERDYAEKLNLYKPEWPAMQQLKTQIDNAKQHLTTVVGENVRQAQDSARSDYLTAMRRESSLKQVLEAQKSEAQDLSSNAVEYNNLRIEIETKRQLLDSLLKKHAETTVASNLRDQRATNFRVVERALPPRRPFAPSIQKNIALALLGGVVLGFGMVLLLSYLDRSLRTPAQLEQALHLPSLGLIPAAGPDGSLSGRVLGAASRRSPGGPASTAEPIELIPHTKARSAVAEAYRSLRASLLLSRAGGIKSILVTSARPGEGKSATATNLAVVLAQLGKPVLLIDADLHRPRLHENFRVSNRVGLVSILAEKIDPMSAIVRTSVPELSLMPAGPLTPNPSGLLASEAMRTLLEYAGMNYEYVVVDAPPIFPVADALLLGPMTDGVVLCVQWGKTPREAVARARDTLERGRVPVLGVVLNGVAEALPGYASGYGYYYGKDDAERDDATAVAGQRG